MTLDDSGSEQPGRIPVVGPLALVAVAGVLAFVAMLDMNIVNVALADIAEGLHVPRPTAPVGGAGVPTARRGPAVAGRSVAGRRGAAPRAARRHRRLRPVQCPGRRPPWAAWLIAARFAQGAFGAVLFVLMPVLAMRSVRPAAAGAGDERARDPRPAGRGDRTGRGRPAAGPLRLALPSSSSRSPSVCSRWSWRGGRCRGTAVCGGPTGGRWWMRCWWPRVWRRCCWR